MKQNKTIRLGLPLLILPFCMAGCDNGDDPQNIETQDNGWELVWQDEFNTPTYNNRPDPANWNYELGNSGYGNQELQNYTNRVENCSYVTHGGEGCLRITALNDNYDGNEFSSARIKTEGRFEQQYGRFEARLKLPYGPGIWPAFWLLGNDYATHEWPACGEIDIMENKGWQPNIISSALHMPGRSGGNPITQTFGYETQRFDTGFHTFGIEWDEERIDFFVDRQLYKRVERTDTDGGEWAFDHPFFIILNLAVGGSFVGNPTDDTEFPQHFYIDYVRVYKKSDRVQPDDGQENMGGSIDEWNPDADDTDKGDTGMEG